MRVYNNSAFAYFCHAYDGDGYDATASHARPYPITTKEADPDIGHFHCRQVTTVCAK